MAKARQFAWRLPQEEMLTTCPTRSYYVLMPTPAAVEPPTSENVHLYRAAALAWRKAWRGERRKEKLANPHVPLDAAALAVRELSPEMTFEQAKTFAQRAVAWVGQSHNAWIFDR